MCSPASASSAANNHNSRKQSKRITKHNMMCKSANHPDPRIGHMGPQNSDNETEDKSTRSWFCKVCRAQVFGSRCPVCLHRPDQHPKPAPPQVNDGPHLPKPEAKRLRQEVRRRRHWQLPKVQQYNKAHLILRKRIKMTDEQRNIGTKFGDTLSSHIMGDAAVDEAVEKFGLASAREGTKPATESTAVGKAARTGIVPLGKVCICRGGQQEQKRRR